MKLDNKKILFVIPAYNESLNIKKVLDEIKKDMPNADIVVINDCSKDNTKDIVLAENVRCIDGVFNLGYAKAMQTGIKFAYENDYSYMIQFDGDGQHIASEVKKLISCAEKGKFNIVIGSRFLESTGYKHPFFRKVGTKVFSSLIKLFTGCKLTDPTSGFQLLDRKTIERYQKMGNYPEYPDANLLIEVLLEGYTIGEVGVNMRLREFGESMHGGIIKPIKYMIKMFYIIMIIGIKNIGKITRKAVK